MCRLDDREPSILPCVEPAACRISADNYARKRTPNYSQLLRSLNTHQHPIQPKHALLQRARVVRYLPRLRWRLSPRFALDHDVEVDELLGEGGHVVLEAERVFPDVVRGENVVALALALAIEDDFVVGVFDFEVDVEGAA